MRLIACCIAVSLGVATLAWAGPQEDYQAGLAAYRVGDVGNAVSILRKGADAGHAPSQALLGEILDIADRNDEAAKYYRLAADQKNADGYFGLATLHATGEGVPRDLKVAREWMLKAAEAGHPRAVQGLARSYIDGGLGLSAEERASPEALRWIQAAAAIDSLPALDRLATAYRKGELGVVADAKKAEEYEARARALRKVPATGKGKGRGKPKEGDKANG